MDFINRFVRRQLAARTKKRVGVGGGGERKKKGRKRRRRKEKGGRKEGTKRLTGYSISRQASTVGFVCNFTNQLFMRLVNGYRFPPRQDPLAFVSLSVRLPFLVCSRRLFFSLCFFLRTFSFRRFSTFSPSAVCIFEQSLR